MILVDSSVWIDHLRCNDHRLATLLETGQVATHDFVLGELALGQLRQRDVILPLLQDLPHAIHADEGEMLDFITNHTLYGCGIGYVDAHLLAAARLSSYRLWTRDKLLHSAALTLNIAYSV